MAAKGLIIVNERLDDAYPTAAIEIDGLCEKLKKSAHCKPNNKMPNGVAISVSNLLCFFMEAGTDIA